MTALTAPDRLPLVVRALRKVAAFEGVSFVLLMVGVLMRDTSSLNPVPRLGMIHGILYTVLVGLVVLSWPWHRWSLWFALLVCTGLSPGAHFAVQATVDRKRARHTV